MRKRMLRTLAVAVVLTGAASAPSKPPVARTAESNYPRVHASPEGSAAAVDLAKLEPCLPPRRVQGARIAALGVYKGGAPTRYSVPDSAHEMAAIALAAEKSGPPLVVILSAYEPVIWDFSEFPSARLRGVVVSGYQGQAVAHLPRRVPVVFTPRNTTGACGKQIRTYEGGRDLEALDAQIRSIFGKPLSSFQGGYEATGFNIDKGPLPQPKTTFDRNLLRSSGPINIDPVSPGLTGLEELVAAGAIRRATKADLDEWNALATRVSSTGHLAPVEAKNLYVHSAYVIVRETTLPRGLYGGNSRQFIVPAGVEKPHDPGSHNILYFMATGTCTERLC